MGSKIGMLFVSTRADGYFGTQPVYDATRVSRVCGVIGIKKAKRLGPTSFFEATQARKPEFALGVYEGGFIFSSSALLTDSVLEPYKAMQNRVLKEFPGAQALVVQVYDVVNLFGYALYQGSQLVRAYGGNGDDDVNVESGDLQPEEVESFQRSWKWAGKRYFSDPAFPLWPFNTPAYGSTLAYKMAGRFLGAPLMTFDGTLDIAVFEQLD